MSDCLTRLSHLTSRVCLHVNARTQSMRQTRETNTERNHRTLVSATAEPTTDQR